MKTPFAAAIGFCVSGCLHAGMPDPNSLTFGGTPTGLPPLSMAERIAQVGDSAQVPTYSGNGDRAPLSPHLVPKAGQSSADMEAARRTHTPQIYREFGMPIIQPSDVVDYKVTLVPPDLEVDFKMLVKDVGSKKSAVADNKATHARGD